MSQADTNQMKTVVRLMIATISRMDHEALGEYLAEDAVMEFPYAPDGMDQRIEGRSAIIEAMSRSSQMFSAFILTPEEIFASPDTATVTVRAKSAGTLIESGTYENDYAILVKFSGDRILLWREYFNPFKLPDAQAQ